MSGPRTLARRVEAIAFVLAGFAFVLTAAGCVFWIIWAPYAAVTGGEWWLLLGLIPAVWWLRFFIGFAREWAWPEFLARD